MKRIAVRVPVFLLIGAAVNVAVAWGCAAWAPLKPIPFDETGWQGDRGWPVKVPADWLSLSSPAASQKGVGIVRATGGYSLYTTPMAADSPSTSFHYVAIRIDAGWPCHSFTASLVEFSRVVNYSAPAGATGPWTSGLAIRGLREGTPATMALASGPSWALPYGPLWAGLALNCGAFAVMGAGVSWSLSAIRERIRIRRHLCPACAYPVGVSSACTECGRPVKAKAAVA